MAVTQFGLIKLAKPTTNDDLQQDQSYTKSIVEVMRRQPGCLKGGWSVIEGKPTSLVWLFGTYFRSDEVRIKYRISLCTR